MSDDTYLANLYAERDALSATLLDMASNPKPNYTVDGQSVSWNTMYDSLRARLDQVLTQLAAADPFELQTQGYTPSA